MSKQLRLDLVGEKVGKWTVLAYDAAGSWHCRCECGLERSIYLGCRRRADPRSFGCPKCADRSHSITHGLTKMPVYAIWGGIKARCRHTYATSYKCYGGRGINVCDRWYDSFDAFFEDMGHPPTGYSIERKDTNGDYCKENCVWIPKAMQAKNTRRTVNITYNGETHCASEWSRRLGLGKDVVRVRFKRGWPIERVMEPPKKRVRA